MNETTYEALSIAREEREYLRQRPEDMKHFGAMLIFKAAKERKQALELGCSFGDVKLVAKYWKVYGEKKDKEQLIKAILEEVIRKGN